MNWLGSFSGEFSKMNNPYFKEITQTINDARC
jgi:hypothetical protein